MRIALKPLAAAALVGISLGSGVAVAQYTQKYADPSQSAGTTREQQKDELRRLEQNGYRPGSNDPYYPRNIQRAEERARGQTSTGGVRPGRSGYGTGTSQDYRGESATPTPGTGTDMDNGMSPGQRRMSPSPSTPGQ